MFTCPICNAFTYRRVVVKTTRGPYETEFYECNGCTAMFRDPQSFSCDRTPKVSAPDFKQREKRDR